MAAETFARARIGRALGLAFFAGLVLGCGSQERPPNILLYVVDTMRADALGSYGNPDASTPGFDELAREGVVFGNAYANSSWTRASMGSILTGLLPWNHGAVGRGDRLPEDVRTLAALLAEHGYRTALVTANPNVGSVFGFGQSFDDTIELYARSRPGEVRGKELITPSDAVSDEALGWLDSAERPFLLVVLAIDPHAPYTPPRRFDPARLRTKSAVNGFFKTLGRDDLSTDDKARIRELYQAEVAFNDDSFAHLISGLRRRGVLDDTITVVTSDHGEEFWEYDRRGHGHSLSEEVLRVPLLLRYPGDRRLPAGGRTERPIQLVDLVPSLLDLAGLPIPDGLDGRSFFASALRLAVEDEPLLLAGLELDGERLLSVREGPRKLVWDLERDSLVLHDLGLARPETAPIDIAHDPEAAETAARLKRTLERSVEAAAARGRRASSQAGELPEQVEESLRALGYLDPVE